MKKTITIMSLMLIGLIASAFAFPGGQLEDEEKSAIKEAIEAGDYDAWKNAVIASLTEERFEKIVERYNDRADKRAAKEAIKDAFETNDYDAFVATVAGLEKVPHFLENVNEDNWDSYVELYEAKQEGDRERVKELMEELGIQKKGLKDTVRHYVRNQNWGR